MFLEVETSKVVQDLLGYILFNVLKKQKIKCDQFCVNNLTHVSKLQKSPEVNLCFSHS